MKQQTPLTAVVVGCGDRATVYCEEGVHQLGMLKIAAAVDPNPERLRLMQTRFHVPPDRCFSDIRDILPLGRIADCVINGTMDQYHLATALPFLEQGYHMLLEKPIVNNAADLYRLRDAADRHGCQLMICHVLRYAPFYQKIKELLSEGALGDIMNIQTSERVGAFHSSVSYLRGKWNSEKECGSSLLLAKCCHDIDLICWLNNTTLPVSVFSNGGRNFFTEDKAPADAGTRCLTDCPEEVRRSCVYDVQSMYLDNCLLPWYPWQCTGKNWEDVTEEEKLLSLKTCNPHGGCIYRTKGDLADHQNLLIRFADGSTAVHTLMLGSMRAGRSIWLQGTKGELEGWIADGILYHRSYDKKTSTYTEKTYRFGDREGETGGHFGGDRGLVKDFCDRLSGKTPSLSSTSIHDSINGHLVCFAGDESLRTREEIRLNQ